MPHKQIEDALNAVAELRPRIPGLHLDIVGGGWWRDRLVDHARLLGVSDAVTFHGHVDDVAKHEVLQRCWVHVLPSRKEGWGLAVTEAAQHGVPTIGYRYSGGLTDSIVDGVTGLLVDDHAEMVVGHRAAADRSRTARPARRQGAGPQRGVLLAAERRRHARGAGVDARGQAGQRRCLTLHVSAVIDVLSRKWRSRGKALTCPRGRSRSCSLTLRG